MRAMTVQLPARLDSLAAAQEPEPAEPGQRGLHLRILRGSPQHGRLQRCQGRRHQPHP